MTGRSAKARRHGETPRAGGVGIGLAMLGAIAVAGSLFAPDAWFGHGRWTAEDAAAHQRAAADAHRLAFADPSVRDNAVRLRDAQRTLVDLESGLLDARDAGPWRRRAALIGGVVSLLAGAIVASRSTD